MSLQFSESKRNGNSVSPEKDWAALLEEAVGEVFSMMLGWEVATESGSPSSDVKGTDGANEYTKQPLIEVLFRREEAAASEGDAEMTAVVGIAGELCGVLNFACDTRAARMMAAQMLGVEEAAVGDQQWDAIGEICNMVAGNFKAKLPGIGERCMLSVPTIVVGSNYRLRTVAGSHRMEYRFRVQGAPVRTTLEIHD